MYAREQEDYLIQRCLNAGQNRTEARDEREANVFHVAAMLLRQEFPQLAQQLQQHSTDYFHIHPEQKLPVAEVIRQGWLISLPRFQQALSLRLR